MVLFQGGVGGYETGGGQGAGIGAVAGGFLGFVNPWRATLTGAIGGSGASAGLGQFIGNAYTGKDVLNTCNYDEVGIVGSMLGGGVGSVANKFISGAVPYTRVNMIGRELGTQGVNRTVGNTAGAVVEGQIAGGGENLTKDLYKKYSNKDK